MPCDASATIAAFDELIAAAQEGAEVGLEQASEALRSLAEAYAPKATGALASSMRKELGAYQAGQYVTYAPGTYSAVVGPTRPGYSRRMELGFHGTDKLGRTYHQAGHWFLHRATHDVEDAVGGIFEDVWGERISAVGS